MECAGWRRNRVIAAISLMGRKSIYIILRMLTPNDEVLDKAALGPLLNR
ncbi:unnamed protein product [Mycetohabitans rhizoxinica HKI 454]|uniref:Uncharacterized protein n=1 Tax=Mycetohabitans rhizoxinica (strain DSM 19002 / CIP 109453 / HKI 454) TaxID=882378 RepID=E5AR94_MYCRK|nr:unnamed protein product [Mycetohabitans rhizoxinica HKI 454]